ncbi:MAG: hypothetical protein FJX47_12715 [Alphaproteobacteria bacterium]|nr:hypothetical protein [Alphaproteobacteria bacterium]
MRKTEISGKDASAYKLSHSGINYKRSGYAVGKSARAPIALGAIAQIRLVEALVALGHRREIYRDF